MLHNPENTEMSNFLLTYRTLNNERVTVNVILDVENFGMRETEISCFNLDDFHAKEQDNHYVYYRQVG